MRAPTPSPHTRVLAIDDAPFARRKGSRVPLVGVLTRGAMRIEGVFSTSVVRDGWQATRAIAAMIAANDLARQARCVLLDGIAVGGFNMVDLPALALAAKLPVVAVMRRLPDLARMRRAMDRVSFGARRWSVVERAGTIHRARRVYVQCAGCEPAWATALVDTVTIEGSYPEPLRLAHVIAAGFVLGRNRSRA